MYSILPIFLFWGIAISIHSKLSKYTYQLGMKNNLHKVKPLYDIVQQSFPNLQQYRFIPEVLHVIPIIALIGFIGHYRDNKSILALKDFLNYHGVLMLLRSIFFTVTSLPDSSEMCTVSTHIGSCFDLIFSGHSTIMLLCTMIIRRYFYISNFVFLMFMFNNIITCFLIIVCRNHYTIDVLISVILTYALYKK